MSVDVTPTIDAMKNALAAVVAEEAAVVAAMAALRTGNTPDYSSISKSEGGGSQSWTMATLQDRLSALEQNAESLCRQIELTQKMAPFTIRHRMRAGDGITGTLTGAHGWRGW
jgi:hypothetical protein